MSDFDLNPTTATIGGSAIGAAAAVPLIASVVKRNPSMIKRYFGKDLKPVIASQWSHNDAGDTLLERLMYRAVLPKKAPRAVGKNEVAILMDTEYQGRLGLLNPYRRIKQITPSGEKGLAGLGDKLKYGKRLHKSGIGARTSKLTGGDIRGVRRAGTLTEAKAHLDKKYGKNKWVIKPRSDNSEQGIPTSNMDQTIFHSGSKKDDVLGIIKKKPKLYIKQDKFDIIKEFRVRSVGDESAAIFSRKNALSPVVNKMGWIVGDKDKSVPMGIMPIGGRTKRDIDKLLKQHSKTVNPSKKLTSMSHDIALVRNADGSKSYKVIETNPVSGGELMYNPVATLSVYKKLTGKAHPIEIGAKSLASAGLVAGSAVAGKSAYEHIKQSNFEESVMNYDQIKQAAFADEMDKIAARGSEIAGTVIGPLMGDLLTNPLAYLIGKHGFGARTAADLARSSKHGISNVVLPGAGAYRLGRRHATEEVMAAAKEKFRKNLTTGAVVAGGVGGVGTLGMLAAQGKRD